MCSLFGRIPETGEWEFIGQDRDVEVLMMAAVSLHREQEYEQFQVLTETGIKYREWPTVH